MSRVTPDAGTRFLEAVAYPFHEPVTAYLTDAVLVAAVLG
jgi:hypothetical protein